MELSAFPSFLFIYFVTSACMYVIRDFIHLLRDFCFRIYEFGGGRDDGAQG